MKSKNAYITLFITLIMGSFIALYLALIESARMECIEAEAECVTDITVNSVLAEYSRALNKETGIFAIDTAYAEPTSGVEKLENHMSDYLSANTLVKRELLTDLFFKDFIGLFPEEINTAKVCFLSDFEGLEFMRHAVESQKEEFKISYFEDLVEWMSIGQEYEEKEDIYMKECNDPYVEELSIEISKQMGTSAEEINSTGIIRSILGDCKISGNRIDTDDLFITRKQANAINKGNIFREYKPQISDKYLFSEYLISNLGTYMDSDKDKALCYGVEYVLGGKETDEDNLKNILLRILLMREAANYKYLLTDTEKHEMVKMLAAFVATSLTVPEAGEAIEQIILLAWAMKESKADLRALLNQKKVVLIKTKETWKTQLIGGKKEESKEDDKNGLTYEDYLRIFIMLTPNNRLCERALSLIEQNIRLWENPCFRIDACITEFEGSVLFSTGYGYEYKATYTGKYE